MSPTSLIPVQTVDSQLFTQAAFHSAKDLYHLLRAFSKLADSFPEWDIDLVGDGTEEKNLRRLTVELGLQDRVKFHGALTDMNAVFATYLNAHMFVLTSRAEGCPLSLREAMAHGLPVIGYDSCTGTNEIIEHGRNGLLAESEDKVEGLISAMSTLMSDGELRRTMGAEGMAVTTQFAPDIVHKKWEDLLIDAAAWKGRRDELRAIKRTRAAEVYDRLDGMLAEICGLGVSRNIVVYNGSVRNAEANDDLIVNYLLLFGSCLFDRNYYYANHLEVKLAGADSSRALSDLRVAPRLQTA